MQLIVCSKSTLKFAKDFKGRVYQVKHPPNKVTIETVVAADEIIAIGGGSVIDTAKILAATSGIEKITAYPTTGAGASETSHAVYWDKGRKYSVDTPSPITRLEIEYSLGLPKNIVINSKYDSFAHLWESMHSVNRTEESVRIVKRAKTMLSIVRKGIMAGQAIEITGTNIIHALSYPLTGHYGIPHGQAVGIMTEWEITKAPIMDYDVDLLVSEALSYPQIHETTFKANEDSVLRRYTEALCL